MLIYSEKRLVPTDINMLVIKGNDDKYYYIHRMLYDQAVVINDIYKDELGTLIQHICGEQKSRADVETFLETAPSPINILGPFLLLIKGELTEYRDMVGAIHAMSGPINFRKLLQTPVEYRTQPEFSLSIKEEYELAWDRFFLNVLEFNPTTTFVKIPSNTPVMGTAQEELVPPSPVIAEILESKPEPAPSPAVQAPEPASSTSAGYQEEAEPEVDLSDYEYTEPDPAVLSIMDYTATTPIGEAGPDDDWSLDKITPEEQYCWANINYHEGMTLVDYLDGLAKDVDPFSAINGDPYIDDAYRSQLTFAFMNTQNNDPQLFAKLMEGRAVENVNQMTDTSNITADSFSTGSDSSSSASAIEPLYSAEELDAMSPEEKAKLKEGLSGLDLLRSGLIA